MSGNGLAVFLDADGWPTSVMQRLTQEMRQIESIFLSAIHDDGAGARIFTEDEELPFAGHPVLGAAAVLHRERAPFDDIRTWRLALTGRMVTVTTSLTHEVVTAEMDQGPASFGPPLAPAESAPLLERLGLFEGDLVEGMPVQVVSTG